MVFDYGSASGVAAGACTLSTALRSAKLLQYEQALRELGVVEPTDLTEMEEEDLGTCLFADSHFTIGLAPVCYHGCRAYAGNLLQWSSG